MNVNERVENLVTEYQQQRDTLAGLHRKMQELSASATSPRREVTVAVGPHGVLTDIQFPTKAHRRLTSAELSALVTATYTQAREQVADKAAALLAPMLPEGLDAHSLVRGTAGLDTFMPPDGSRMTVGLREMLARRKS